MTCKRTAALAGAPRSPPPAGPPSSPTEPLRSLSLANTGPRPRKAEVRDGAAAALHAWSLGPAAPRTALVLALRARCVARGGARAYELTGSQRARPETRTPSLARAPGRASAARRRAHRDRALLSRSLSRLPPLWAFKQLSDITSQGFFPPSP